MSSKKLVLIPLMLCFFAMGFVDLVGIAYAQKREGNEHDAEVLAQDGQCE